MDAISELDLDLPQDLSLICFDDLEWMRFLRPGISAIAQPLNEMGRAAARLILGASMATCHRFSTKFSRQPARAGFGCPPQAQSRSGSSAQPSDANPRRPDGSPSRLAEPVPPLVLVPFLSPSLISQRTSSRAGISPASTAIGAAWPTAPMRVQVSAAA